MTTPAPKNGCHDRRPYRASMVVQDGWFMDGITRVAKVVSVPFRMSPLCNYTDTQLGQTDSRCDGCKWKHTQKEEL